MEPIILLQQKWSESPHVPLYLFLGGLAAGTFVVAAVADLAGLASRRAGTVARLGGYAVLPVLALAGFFLTAHLGKPERGLAFPLFFTNYNSWMTRGGWIVGASAPFMVVYAGLWYLGVAPGLRRIVGLVGLGPAAGLGLYTGFLLSGSMFVPLWDREYLPVLFLNSGVNTGLALVGLLTLLAWPWAGVPGTSVRPAARWLGAALLVFVVLEGVELYRFMRDLAGQGLLRGHTAAATGDRFRYEVAPGGALPPGTYVVAVTWVNNATGAEEGMSAETPVSVVGGPGRLLVTAPRRLGRTYNVYLGTSRRDARQVAANLSPADTVTIDDLAPASLAMPENLQTGGLFVAASGGPVAYRYVTGGPAYPWRLFDRRPAEATSDALRGFLPSPTLVQDARRTSLAGWFWWGVVGLALALPVTLTGVEVLADVVRPAWANGVAVVKFAAVLAGGLILRFVVVWGGDLKAPLAFPPSTWPFPGLPLPGATLPGLGG
ncbi:MAG: NrfD/PsrC family molybdoenzyme membrane anchor subunit [Candidatus Rokuibacteriota bacterium]